MREEFSRPVKREAFARCKGRCEECGSILKPRGFEYDHDKPAAFEGRGVAKNCRVLCIPCHDQKTYGRDIPAIAKSNRIRSHRAGIRRKSRFQTSRDGPFKAKIGGGVERRQR